MPLYVSRSHAYAADCLIILLLNTWAVSSLGLLSKQLLWTFVNKSCVDVCLFLVGKYAGVELPGCLVNVCLPSQEIAQLFSKVVVPFYFSSDNVCKVRSSFSCYMSLLELLFIQPLGSLINFKQANNNHVRGWSHLHCIEEYIEISSLERL